MTAPLVVIVGPTASGKSDLAIKVAKQCNGEIICGDSRTLYKGMDIGTAKPTLQEQQSVRHHLVDIIEPNQSFTAAEFKRLANMAIEDISSRGKLPILVGGSGLYIDAVIFDYSFGPAADPQKRSELNGMSIEQLQRLCREKNIDLPNNHLNKRYLIRTLELGGQLQHSKTLRPNTIVVGISTERSILRERIVNRAHKMVEQGLLDEVATLSKRYGWESEAMKGNAYQVYRPVVEGIASVDAGIEESIKSDMRLAKKQLTWFKRNKQILWGDPEHLLPKIVAFVQERGS